MPMSVPRALGVLGIITMTATCLPVFCLTVFTSGAGQKPDQMFQRPLPHTAMRKPDPKKSVTHCRGFFALAIYAILVAMKMEFGDSEPAEIIQVAYPPSFRTGRQEIAICWKIIRSQTLPHKKHVESEAGFVC